MACALSAGAQGIYQFADPGFEQDFTKIGSYKEPGNGWHSFASANNSTGLPSSLALMFSPHPTQMSTGVYSGLHAVQLESKEAVGKKQMAI